MAQPKGVYRLSCSVQEYDWGKPGSSSLVAQFAPNAKGPAFTLSEDGSYAEVSRRIRDISAAKSSLTLESRAPQLWVGTHPNAPSDLFASTFSPVPAVSASLQSILSTHPDQLLGPALLKKWPGVHQLPYLFKVLSIAKALPLQAHPDRKLGEKLHKKDSESYVDENHKPEIAVVIGEPGAAEWIPFGGKEDKVGFTGFVGFRPLEEIVDFVTSVPELIKAIGNNHAIQAFVSDPTKETLKTVWSSLLERGKSETEVVGDQVRTLVKRLKYTGETNEFKDARPYARLLEKVNEQYKGDVGVLATTFFMNFVQLKQGEALWIPADEVHAYLEGGKHLCCASLNCGPY